MRPPAAGFSTRSSTSVAEALLGTRWSGGWLAHGAVDRRRLDAPADMRPPAFVRETASAPRPPRTRAPEAWCHRIRCPQRVDERRIELIEPLDQRRARLTAKAPRPFPRRIQLSDDAVQNRIEGSIDSRSTRGQPRDDPLEMRRKTRPRTSPTAPHPPHSPHSPHPPQPTLQPTSSTRQTHRARRPRRTRCVQAAAGDPWRSSARNTGRCHASQSSAESRVLPSRTPARMQDRRSESSGRRSSDRGMSPVGGNSLPPVGIRDPGSGTRRVLGIWDLGFGIWDFQSRQPADFT